MIPLLLKIKAAQIHNLSDARYFATFAEWLGIDFNPASEKSVDLSTAQELIGWVSGPKIVGEFGEQNDLTQINNICQALQISTIEIAETVYIDYTQLSPVVDTIIRRIRLNPQLMNTNILESLLSSLAPHTKYFLLELPFTWQQLQMQSAFTPAFFKELCQHYAIILQMPFTVASVSEIATGIQPYAFNFVGSSEEAVGIKSFEAINDMIEQLEIEDW